MQHVYIAAAIQMNSGSNRQQNLQTAEQLVHEAAGAGAKLVVLPELFGYLGELPTLRSNSETMDGITLATMRNLAIELDIVLCAGSLAILGDADDSHLFNRSVLYGSQGQILAIYDKIHCFDVELPDVQIRESKYIQAGGQVSVTSTPLGHIGQAICYDLRFPELFRRQSEEGMQVCVVPSAFTARTGKAHWDTLTRARAIENQVFVIAANQCGMYGSSVRCHGHSQIVDPWGVVLAEAGNEPTVIYAEIDLARLRQIRGELPALTHRRLR